MKQIVLSVLFSILTFAYLAAQVSIPDFNPVTIDFTGFAGAGFTPTPGADQLDSDDWSVSGFSFSTGTVAFGGTGTSSDFARGSSNGGETTGGIYAFNTGGGDVGLGVQPGGSDFTPGYFRLRIQNNTGSTLDEISIDYDIYVLNDQNRSNSFNFAYSGDDATYTPVPALDFASPAASSGTAWNSTARSTTISGLSIAPGDFFYFEWSGDDVSGSGSRDEFALDNIVITATDPGGSPMPSTGAITKFLPGNGNTVAPTFEAGEVTVSDLQRGAGLSQTTGGDFNSTGWSTGSTLADALSNNDYVFFTVTVDDAVTLDLTTLDVRYDRSGMGPTTLEIVYQINGGGFTSIFIDNSVSSSSEEQPGLDFSSVPTLNQGDLLEIRFVGFNATSSAGTFDIEDTNAFDGSNGNGLILSGTITPVTTMAAIPTMSEWGFFLFIVIMMNVFVVALYNQKNVWV